MVEDKLRQGRSSVGGGALAVVFQMVFQMVDIRIGPD
jgi:hypothetical protein